MVVRSSHSSSVLAYRLDRRSPSFDQGRSDPTAGRAVSASRPSAPSLSANGDLELRQLHWAPYWGAAGLSHNGPFQLEPAPTLEDSGQSSRASILSVVDAHLRSADEIIGYYLQARDGQLGQVDDILVDETHWAVRFLAIAIRNWWSVKKFTIPANWLAQIRGDEHVVCVSRSRDDIKNATDRTSGPSVGLARDLRSRAWAERDVEGSGRAA
jgi:hypothetical protein